MRPQCRDMGRNGPRRAPCGPNIAVIRNCLYQLALRRVLCRPSLGDKDSAQLASLVGHYLDTLKAQALRSLSVDPEAQKNAKKARLDAKRLGNLPLEEVQRIQQNAREWLLDVDVTPVQLMKASPQVLSALMPLFKATAIGLQPMPQDTPALPADKPEGGA